MSDSFEQKQQEHQNDKDKKHPPTPPPSPNNSTMSMTDHIETSSLMPSSCSSISSSLSSSFTSTSGPVQIERAEPITVMPTVGATDVTYEDKDEKNNQEEIAIRKLVLSQMKRNKIFEMDKHNEPVLLGENPSRFVLFPLQFNAIWKMYVKHVASFWTVQEVDLSSDMKDWAKLTKEEKWYLGRVIGFFAASDGIVSENLASRFMVEVQIPEARCFYGFQLAMENIHSEMYSLLIDTYIKKEDERKELFNAAQTIPAIKQKADWAIKWMQSDSSTFSERLLAFAVVEGVFFSGAFCSIYWMKKRGLMPGLCFSNELISRDEGLHVEFACLLYNMLMVRVDYERVKQLFTEAVTIEKMFVVDAIPVELIGMNATLMCQYIEFVADTILTALKYPKIYNASNPFLWMEMISIQGKTNFFEKRVGEYQKAGVMDSVVSLASDKQDPFDTTGDF